MYCGEFLCALFPAIKCITLNTGTCYSQPDCEEGTEIEISTGAITPDTCCVGTNDGQSYADRSGNCVVTQCVGERLLLMS